MFYHCFIMDLESVKKTFIYLLINGPYSHIDPPIMDLLLGLMDTV